MALLEPVSAGFVDSAPKTWTFDARVGAPPERVFAALTADPATWKEWFPGFGAGGYDSQAGLGAKRWVRVGGVTYKETVVESDEPSRWTYRVDETTIPVARALVERWTMDPDGDGTRVRWTFAVDPGLVLKVSGPLAQRLMGALFERAMRNLSSRLG